jgi:hypothetical protein
MLFIVFWSLVSMTLGVVMFVLAAEKN